jgi:hypothetical protein
MNDIFSQSGLIAFAFTTVFLSTTCHATTADSSALNPHEVTQVVAMHPASKVNTQDCQVIESSPYVIVAGNGGGNMRLNCPVERPVVYSWRFQVGYGGFLAVNAGGGQTWITCCSMKDEWEAKV